MSYTDALSISESVHLVVTHRDANGDCRHVGTCHLVWRPVLAAQSGRLSQSVELSGVGSEASIPAGVLDLTLELFPKGGECEGVGSEGVMGEEVIVGQRPSSPSRDSEEPSGSGSSWSMPSSGGRSFFRCGRSMPSDPSPFLPRTRAESAISSARLYGL